MDRAGAFAAEIDGLSRLTAVSGQDAEEYLGAYRGLVETTALVGALPSRSVYEHLDLYRGLAGSGGGRPVELRALPAETSEAAADEFLGVVRRWASIDEDRAVVDVLDFGEGPSPWVLVDRSFDRQFGAVVATLSTDQRCDVIDEVAAALEVAHDEGFAHGHLDPINVRFAGDGSVAVDDWGLGRVLAVRNESPYVTPFTAPEELDDSIPAEGPAIDVYRLAGVAYTALAERVPCEADPEAILGGELAPASSLADLPSAVDPVFERGLSRAPADRPETPSAFARQLRDALGLGQGDAGAGAAAAGATGAAAAETPQGTDASGDQSAEADAAATGPAEGAGEGSDQPSQEGGQSEAAPQQSEEAGGPADGLGPGGQTDGQEAAAGQAAQAEDEPAALGEEEGYDRRTVLAAGGGLAALAAVGFGALQLLDGDDGASANQQALDRVPAEADAMVHGDLATLLADEAFVAAVDDQLATGDLETTLETVATETGIDFREAEDVTVFAAGQGGARAAAVFDPETSPDEIRATAAESGRLEREETYAGQPVYRIAAPEIGRTLTVGDLGTGEIAVGSRAAVESAIDRQQGDAEVVDGGVREGFAAADGGVAQSGFVVPEGVLEALDIEGVAAVLLDVEYGYAALPADADGALTVSLAAPSENEAGSLQQLFESLPVLLESSDAVDLPAGIDDQLRTALDDLSAETDGNVVTVTVPDGYLVLAVLLGYALS